MVGAVAFAADKGMSWKDACDLAMAASAGAVTTKGTNPPTRALVEVLLKQVKQVKL
jgi:1-phosphofructokinase